MQNLFTLFSYQEGFVPPFLTEMLFIQNVFCFSFCFYRFFNIPTAHTRIRESNAIIYHVNI